MVVMENCISQEQFQELWLKIDQLHLSYLEMEESTEKIMQRNRLEDCITEFLCIVPHKLKFAFPETEAVLYRSAAFKKDFSGYRAATGWNALQMYAGNLLAQPWRKEYRHLKTYCGFYKHQIEANLIGAEKIFEIIGYKPIGNGILALDGPICPDRAANISRDCLVAYVECQILKHLWEEVSTVFNISWLEILDYRSTYSGSPDQCIKNLKYKYSSKHVQEPLRNPVVDAYETKYHPTSPTTNQVPMPVPHNYIPPPNHNHVALPVQGVPYYMPHTNGCPNSFATYGYAPCNAHIPVVKQPMPAMIAPNSYYYANGFPMVSPGYPVPTGQLIEIESRNGYDTVDGAAAAPRSRRSRINSNATYENDRGSRTDELPKNGVTIREDDKQDSGEDWDYVYRNLERQGYSKDLGERGDVLGLSLSEKQRRHSREIKKIKATNLDEAMRDLSVNDKPLKMTEALERVDQKSTEKVSHPKERRHSQGSSYENVTPNEAAVLTKVPVKLSTSFGTQGKVGIKDKVEKEIPKNIVKVEEKKIKDKEKVLSSQWECKSCTFLNSKSNDICEICSKSRVISRERPMEVGGAECSKCTLVNPRSAKACQACNSDLKDSPTYI